MACGKLGGLLLAITLALFVQPTVEFTAGVVPAGIAYLIGCFGALGLFLSVEHRDRHPLIPLRRFTHRSVLAASGVMLASGGAMASAFYFMTLQWQRVEGFSPLQTGALFLPLSVATLLAGTLSARVQQRLGEIGALRVGTVLTSLGLGVSALLFHLRLPCVVSGTAVLFGAGIALTLAGSAQLATARLSGDDAGFASGMIATSQHVGAVIVLAAGAWFSAAVLPETAGAARYPLGLVGAAVACVGAFGCTFLAPRRDDPTWPAPAP